MIQFASTNFDAATWKRYIGTGSASYAPSLREDGLHLSLAAHDEAHNDAAAFREILLGRSISRGSHPRSTLLDETSFRSEAVLIFWTLALPFVCIEQKPGH